MSNFVVHDNMINLQVDSNNQSKWFMVTDDNNFEFLTSADTEHSKLSEGGVWRIKVQKTPRHNESILSVSTYSIPALYDYINLNFIRNNFKVIIFNNMYEILVTETD